MLLYPNSSPAPLLRSRPTFATVSPDALEVEWIEDPSRFALMQREWDELLQDSYADCLFLTWEWLHTWWEHLAGERRLHLFTVRRAGQLLAIAPLVVRPRQPERLLPFEALEFLGMGAVGSDYLDFIVRRGTEEDVLEAVADHLAGCGRVLELRQVRAGSRFSSRVAARLQKAGWAASLAITDVCPYLDLAGHSWDSYLAGVGSAHRQNVRRRLRRLAASFQVEFQQVRSEAQRRECLPLFARLHRLRWAGRRGSDALDGEGIMEFHDAFTRIALQRGWLRLFMLNLDGKPAASLYAFRYGRAFYFYQSGFDPAYRNHSVGLVAMAFGIQRALEEGADEYDLLHGDEEYKFLWARGGRDLVRFDCYPPGVEGTFCRRAVDIRRGLKRVVHWPQQFLYPEP